MRVYDDSPVGFAMETGLTSQDTPDTPDSPDGQAEISDIQDILQDGWFYWQCIWGAKLTCNICDASWTSVGEAFSLFRFHVHFMDGIRKYDQEPFRYNLNGSDWNSCLWYSGNPLDPDAYGYNALN